jgi:hypothetical protein
MILRVVWRVNLSNADEAEPSAALGIALGIDRLKSAAMVRAKRASLSQAWHDLESSTQRFVIQVVLLGGLAGIGFASIVGPGKPASQTWAHFLLESATETMRLFTFQYSTHADSWVTRLARLVYPLALFFVGTISLSRRYGRRFFAWLTARRGNHLVLVGDSPVCIALARAYRERLNRGVIAVLPTDPGAAFAPLERAGADVVIGDAREAAVLEAAGVQKATALIADGIGGGVVGLAAAVSEATRKRSHDRLALPFVIRLDHRELRELATVHLASSLRQSSVDPKPYVREATVARGLLARYPPDWGLRPGPHDIHAVVFGLGETGRELVLQLARIAVPSAGRRTVLTVIDRDTDALKERLLAEYPGLSSCAELRFKRAEVASGDIPAADLSDWISDPLPATSIYVACGDDRTNLAIVLGLRRAMARSGVVSPPLFVHQRGGPAEVRVLPQIHARDLDALRIISFGSVDEEADPVFLIDGEIDALARRLHQNYLASVSTPGPARVPWPELDEGYRAANRSLADHLQAKLRALALHATAESGAMAQGAWTWSDSERSQFEALARQEHDRWCRDRWLRGWTYGESRDDERLRHPDLVPYDKLDEPGREKDRRIIANLPKDLVGLGMGLSRDRRIGIWFDEAAPSNERVTALLARLEEGMAADLALHWQLVLPLRASAEWTVATTLAKRHAVAIDAAVIGSPAQGDIGSAIDRTVVQKLIAAADRAFVLMPARQAGQTEGAARLAALCDVCDSVWVIGLDDEGNARIEQVTPDQSAKRATERPAEER